MTRRILILAGITLLLGSHGLARMEAGTDGAKSAIRRETSPPVSLTGVAFAVARVHPVRYSIKLQDLSYKFVISRGHFEQNATDGDVEVVFEVKGGDEGLVKLNVVSPDGRTVVDFTAPDASTLGMRQFRFESPEPKDVKSLKAAYPEGVYTFAGATASGNKLHGKSTLSHKLPATVSFIQPKAEAQDVSTKNLIITWTPVKNLAAYIIYIEQDELDVSLTAKLPGSVAAFTVPDGFLLPGTEYQLGIGTVTDEGNISFVETTFTTAGKE